MRSIRTYNQPNYTTSYTIVQIMGLVDAGTIQAKSIADRARMRAILRNNIEAQKAWGRATMGFVSAGHWAMVKKLESYLKRVPAG